MDKSKNKKIQSLRIVFLSNSYFTILPRNWTTNNFEDKIIRLCYNKEKWKLSIEILLIKEKKREREPCVRSKDSQRGEWDEHTKYRLAIEGGDWEFGLGWRTIVRRFGRRRDRGGSSALPPLPLTLPFVTEIWSGREGKGREWPQHLTTTRLQLFWFGQNFREKLPFKRLRGESTHDFRINPVIWITDMGRLH